MHLRTLNLTMLAILAQVAMAEELPNVQLPAMTIYLDEKAPNATYIYNKLSDNKTLGDAVKGISGVQSSSFGPHAGSPVVRSLSGNRVNITENGMAVNGLNAMSAGTNIAFDPVFHRLVGVQKFNNVVKEGGHAIGGSVEIDGGLVPKYLNDEPVGLEVHLQKGFNDIDSHGIKANFNNQKNISVNVLYSTQQLDGYDIVGASKAGVCDSQLISRNQYGLGYDMNLVNSCQRQPVIKSEFNIASKKYYMPDYYDMTTGKIHDKYSDWGLELTDVFTNTPNPRYKDNPYYVAGTPDKIEKVDKILDITENYHKKLGNSDLENHRLGVAGSYFWQGHGKSNYIALSADTKHSRYGLPGFSMSNLGAGLDYKSGQPVRIDGTQNKLAVEAQTHHASPWLNRMTVRAGWVDEQSKENVGEQLANDYRFRTSQFATSAYHQPQSFMSGVVGVNGSKRQVQGAGESVYLPNVNTTTYGMFLQETLSFKPVDLTLGYRHERVEHDIAGDFATHRNAKNTKLEGRKYGLDSYDIQASFRPFDQVGIKARYADSQRAPDINELYASNLHYSIMAHEEGNQNLKPERVKSKELSVSFDGSDFDVNASVYANKFTDYIHMASSGAITGGARMPLKYWQQNDVQVTGFEVDVSRDFDLGRYGSMTISSFADLVKNKHLNAGEVALHNDGIYMPNMPTNRYGLGVKWQYQDWQVGIDGVYYDEPRYQNAKSETALPAYTLISADVKKDVYWLGSPMTLRFGGTNLLNEDARPHNSPLRYIAPLPARAFTVGVTARF